MPFASIRKLTSRLAASQCRGGHEGEVNTENALEQAVPAS